MPKDSGIEKAIEKFLKNPIPIDENMEILAIIRIL